MILLDSNVLVALVDPRDHLRPAALRDLGRVARSNLLVAGPVLVEACYLLPAREMRRKLRALIDRLRLTPVATESLPTWEAVFDWLDQYAEHQPDWTDACLAVLSGSDKRLKIWTYDREFSIVWRRPDGTKIPLAVPAD